MELAPASGNDATCCLIIIAVLTAGIQPIWRNLLLQFPVNRIPNGNLQYLKVAEQSRRNDSISLM